MPATSTISPSRRLVSTVCEGRISLRDIKADMDRLRSHPDFDPSYSQLVDVRRATIEMSPRDIVECAELPLFLPHARRAIVASTDLGFGMARMYATYREIQGELNLMVFRSLEEALSWTCDEQPRPQPQPHTTPDTPSLF